MGSLARGAISLILAAAAFAILFWIAGAYLDPGFRRAIIYSGIWKSSPSVQPKALIQHRCFSYTGLGMQPGDWTRTFSRISLNTTSLLMPSDCVDTATARAGGELPK